MSNTVVLSPKVLKASAIVFLLATSLHSIGLIYYSRHSFPTATIGARCKPAADQHAMRVDQVDARGAADRAGLRTGDHIHAVNGQQLVTAYPFWNAIDRGRPGDTVVLTVQRSGDPAYRDVRIALEPPFIPNEISGAPLTAARIAALHVLSFYPIPFLVVAAVVLAERSHDRHAWLLALLFASFIAGSRPLELEPIIHPLLRKPLIAYCVLLGMLPPGALYFFFATFPEPTPLDRRVPWLKALLLALPLVSGAFLATATVLSPETPSYVRPGGLSPGTQRWFEFALGMYSIAGYGLGLGSLAWHAFRGTPETRRRTRVMLAGTAGAILPIMILAWYSVTYRMELIDFPFWVWVGAILALFLLPLSFAYAVVKHRVMEIPVLIRRSARYVLVRHAITMVGIVFAIILTFAFAAMFSRLLPEGAARSADARAAALTGPTGGVTETERRAMSGVAGAVFGVLIMFATRKGVSKVTHRLDRAFFREAYDARQLLQDVAQQTRSAVDRQHLAELLERSLAAALHPRSILVLLRTPAERLEPIHGSFDAGQPSLDAAAVERDPALRSGVMLVRPGTLHSSLAPLNASEPELLAPMQGHDERIEGLLVLGPRLSDEPYGREDRELVASVAGQAGVALQSLRLARVIAERMEAERRAVHELEIAREVQAKLLPQRTRQFESLDYAGICIQAREVGGDYYDFLDLGPRRLGLVLADVSGKGISAALLMASLQASLRSHYTWTPDDLPRILHAVNRAFFESSETSRYATLFFGIYDEDTARIRYANCGHLPPVLLGPDGSVRRLNPTAPVIGLFDEWKCDVRETDLAPGDTLLIFSDGVVEAFDGKGNEFGEDRLIELVRQNASLSADQFVSAVVAAVQRHSGSAASDDFTMIVGRGHPRGGGNGVAWEEQSLSLARGR